MRFPATASFTAAAVLSPMSARGVEKQLGLAGRSAASVRPVRAGQYQTLTPATKLVTLVLSPRLRAASAVPPTLRSKSMPM